MEAELAARRRSVKVQVQQRSDAWRTYVHALLPTAAGMHIDEHRLLQLQHSKSTQLLTHSQGVGAGGAGAGGDGRGDGTGDGGGGAGCPPPPFAWRPSSAESLSAAHVIGGGRGGEGQQLLLPSPSMALPSMSSLPSLASQLIDDKRSLLASVRQMLSSPCRSMDGITPLNEPVRQPSPVVKMSRSASASRFRSAPKPRPASSGTAQRASPSRVASAGMLRPQSAFVRNGGGVRDEWVDTSSRLAHELD